MSVVKNELKLIGILFVLVIITSILIVKLGANKYTAYYPVSSNESIDTVSVSIDHEELAEVTDLKIVNGYIRVQIKSKAPGNVVVTLVGLEYIPDTISYGFAATILDNGMIFSDNMAFRGFRTICLVFSIFFIVIGIVLFRGFFKINEIDYYSYDKVLHLGLSFYLIVQGLLVMVIIIYSKVFRPDLGPDIIIYFVTYLMWVVVFLLIPFAFIYGLLMGVSNVQLVCHEGFRFVNLLGIIISALIIFGCFFLIFISMLGEGASSSDARFYISRYTFVFGSTLIFYFSCILFATHICLIASARRKVSYDKDFIIILGCMIRKDGTLYPLIRGRVDKAVELYKKQLEDTGKKAFLVPSGGKGDDEPIAEAEAMKNYLVEIGIPEEQIIVENKSKNTLENMKFSKKLIDDRQENANIVFSTTNYHIFRSGMIAKQAGMDGVGIGSRTKWYFWPNAQIREFIGILVKKWKINLLFCILLIIQSLFIANLIDIIGLFAR